ncbi:MAG: hypothetical protein CVV58_06960 [Tenericutes bacterium HGW-Tenericutes-3]|nr:MAG: hypothetical protein CVV58_06960 [Tenericutes bacterium HGW-Tenericutes-3]
MTKHKKGKVLNTLFFVVISIMLFYIVINTFFPDQSINFLGFKSYVVISPSMEPDIKVNDLVVVVKVKEEKLEVGDVISFYTYLPTSQVDDLGNTVYLKSVVTHYLAAINDDGTNITYKTRRAGVADDAYDDWNDINGDPTDLTFDDIIGRVSFTVPKVGSILKIFTNPIMVVLIVVNVSIIVAVVKVTKKALSDGKTA